jgi:hypothetical protein
VDREYGADGRWFSRLVTEMARAAHAGNARAARFGALLGIACGAIALIVAASR